MRLRVSSLGLMLITTVFALCLSEFIARRVIELKIPNFSTAIQQSIENKVRMWPANVDIEYDIRGLYLGASKVRLRTDPFGFIEPVPRESSSKEPKILFRSPRNKNRGYCHRRENQQYDGDYGSLLGGKRRADYTGNFQGFKTYS